VNRAARVLEHAEVIPPVDLLGWRRTHRLATVRARLHAGFAAAALPSTGTTTRASATAAASTAAHGDLGVRGDSAFTLPL
jgi:hypothetical protein